jgi:hypothetical protein
MSRVAVYSGPYLRGLRGLGDPAICLDQNQNTIDCQDPNCTYGDCGQVSTSVPSGACLDQSQNQVLCMDPNCTYGDCLPSSPAPAKKPSTVISPALTAAVAATITPRPSPVVSVPLTTSTVGMWLGSDMIPGVPNWALIGGTLAIALVLGGGGRRRR